MFFFACLVLVEMCKLYFTCPFFVPCCVSFALVSSFLETKFVYHVCRKGYLNQIYLNHSISSKLPGLKFEWDAKLARQPACHIVWYSVVGRSSNGIVWDSISEILARLSSIQNVIYEIHFFYPIACLKSHCYTHKSFDYSERRGPYIDPY